MVMRSGVLVWSCWAENKQLEGEIGDPFSARPSGFTHKFTAHLRNVPDHLSR